MNKHRPVCFAAIALLGICAAATAGTWRESSVADFGDGVYNANTFPSEEGSDSGRLKTNPGAFFDLNKDGRPDLVISNMHDNSGNFDIDSYIYWGKHDWTYSADSCQALPTFGATGNSVEDLNKDGHLDVLFSCYDGPYSIIYWGSRTGFHTGDTTLLETNRAHGNYIADLNHDGRLDIIIANMGGGYSYIYWADKHDPGAFSSRTELAGYGSSDIAIADLDKDGVLDLVLPNKQGDYPPAGGFTFNIPSYIYYGQKTGDSIFYNDAGRDSLETHGAYCVSVGDVDKNGWLDIVFSNVHDGASYNIDSYIYFGSSTGFTSRVDLPTKGAIGNNIVDLDRDGHEDVVFANWYDRDSAFTMDTHDVPTYIYWGPDFSARTDLPSHGAHGAMVGKISSNNVNDVLITNSVIGAGFNGSTFHTWSYIYHGVGRAGYVGLDSVPSYYGHIYTKDNGNVHDRGGSEEYLSSVFGDGSATQSWNSCSWTADIPAGSALDVALRGGDTPVPDETWSAWQAAVPGKSPLSVPPSKYLQYRLTSTANDLFQTPAVDEVAVDYAPQGVAGGPGAPAPSVSISANGSGVTVSLALARAGRVKVSIYNMLGQAKATLADGVLGPGTYRYDWRGQGAASGIYLCAVEAGGSRAVRR
ncbi:VCBS repeat-containing protein, partial [bacterium]|nr:VCBS repeat-containing protein [bacterium]